MAAKPSGNKDSTWHDRRKKAYDRRQGRLVECKPKDWDLESYTIILAGLRWVAVQLAEEKITHEESNAFKAILGTAGDNLKKKIQRAGQWWEKREEKHTHDISDKLAECLLKVQGSTPEQLKKMKGEVDKLIRGLRE